VPSQLIVQPWTKRRRSIFTVDRRPAKIPSFAAERRLELLRQAQTPGIVTRLRRRTSRASSGPFEPVVTETTRSITAGKSPSRSAALLLSDLPPFSSSHGTALSVTSYASTRASLSPRLAQVRSADPRPTDFPREPKCRLGSHFGPKGTALSESPARSRQHRRVQVSDRESYHRCCLRLPELWLRSAEVVRWTWIWFREQIRTT